MLSAPTGQIPPISNLQFNIDCPELRSSCQKLPKKGAAKAEVYNKRSERMQPVNRSNSGYFQFRD